MLLAVDVGNTNIVFGVYDKDRWIYDWRIRTIRDKMPDEYGIMLISLLREVGLSMQSFDTIALCSVVPPLTGYLEEMFALYTPIIPVVINHTSQTGLTFAVDNPAEVGADLLADAVAAYDHFHDACVVVDFGTATTFTAISASAQFLGVAIAPGVKLAASALSGGTAQLPLVRLSAPAKAIGTNTTHAIQSGVLLGYVSLVEGMLDRFAQELNFAGRIVATGGFSAVIAPLTHKFALVDPLLTLDGIRLIAEKNL
ncbi:MAG: type III pantothenate kinase [Anaerolineales bacterium]|nr:MAG: type III pantothenate kinase [Anaerolineales bacterium]